jgi:hypothetical protein
MISISLRPCLKARLHVLGLLQTVHELFLKILVCTLRGMLLVCTAAGVEILCVIGPKRSLVPDAAVWKTGNSSSN